MRYFFITVCFNTLTGPIPFNVFQNYFIQTINGEYINVKGLEKSLKEQFQREAVAVETKVHITTITFIKELSKEDYLSSIMDNKINEEEPSSTHDTVASVQSSAS